MDIAPTYPIYNQGCNPLTIRGMSHQVETAPDWIHAHFVGFVHWHMAEPSVSPLRSEDVLINGAFAKTWWFIPRIVSGL